MANEEQISAPGGISAFKVQRRPLNISGIDRNKNNRPFNKNYNARPIKPNPEFEKLVEAGIIKNITKGSKQCFFVKELSSENKAELSEVLKLEDKFENDKIDAYELADDWWTASTVSKDGENPSEVLKPGIEKYHSFEDPENKNCLTIYGEVGLKIDFSKLNMFTNDGNVYDIPFPYGVLFFSDSTSFVNQFAATCAVIQRRFENAKNNTYIKPVNDWENETIKGSFRSHGHFVIFYASGVENVPEDANDDFNGNYPVITTIDIEVFLNRNKDGTIRNVGIGKVETVSATAKFYQYYPFDSEIDYLIKNVFAKHVMKPIASSRFVSDYIYLIGDNPRNYDLSVFVEEKDKGSEGKTSKEGFGSNKPAPNNSGKPNGKSNTHKNNGKGSNKPETDSEKGTENKSTAEAPVDEPSVDNKEVTNTDAIQEEKEV